MASEELVEAGIFAEWPAEAWQTFRRDPFRSFFYDQDTTDKNLESHSVSAVAARSSMTTAFPMTLFAGSHRDEEILVYVKPLGAGAGETAWDMYLF